MEWTPYRLLLAVVLAFTGSASTILGKWADREVAMGVKDCPPRQFNHPFFQAIVMFLGETMCGLVFCIILLHRKRQGQSPKAALGNMTFNLKEIVTQKGSLSNSFFVFFPSAMCDLIGTSLLFMALNYTTAASYQMLRGSVTIFVALLSVAFLRRVIGLVQWVGILTVMAGLIVVGLADFLFNPATSDLNSVITGDELVVLSQAIAACQLVWEEKFVTKLDVNPLLAVGLEGIYGFIVLSLLCIPMYWISVGPQFSGSPEYRLEDVLDAFAMMANDWQIAIAMVGLLLSYAFFNWAGISVTKELSATTRMILDSFRTFIVWAVTLGLGWQAFQWLQIVGFVVLTAGIFIYNRIITWQLVKDAITCKCCKRSQQKEEIPPLSVESDDTFVSNPYFYSGKADLDAMKST